VSNGVDSMWVSDYMRDQQDIVNTKPANQNPLPLPAPSEAGSVKYICFDGVMFCLMTIKCVGFVGLTCRF